MDLFCVALLVKTFVSDMNNEQWSNFCGDAMAVAFFEAIRNQCFLTHVTIASDAIYHWT